LAGQIHELAEKHEWQFIGPRIVETEPGSELDDAIEMLLFEKSDLPLHTRLARAVLEKLLGIGSGTKAIAVGSKQLRELADEFQVPWEALLVHLGADLTIAEKDPDMYEDLKSREGLWLNQPGSLKVLPPEKSRFEQIDVADHSLDAIVMMSVLSDPSVSDKDRENILLPLAINSNLAGI